MLPQEGIMGNGKKMAFWHKLIITHLSTKHFYCLLMVYCHNGPQNITIFLYIKFKIKKHHAFILRVD